jgi:hypothetical protein
MLYHIIYSVDVPQKISITLFKPPYIKRWKQTEGDKQYEYSYLDGDWEKGKHRRWVGTLLSGQFKEFVEEQELYATDDDNGGAIGSPANYFGWSPAIIFRRRDSSLAYNCIDSIYVTPEPEDPDFIALGIDKDSHEEEDWDKIVEHVMKEYGK